MIYDETNINRFYLSPYLKLDCRNGAICFLQTLTGKSFVIPGGSEKLEMLLDEMRDGKEREDLLFLLGRIFGNYDSEELLIGMLQMGVFE